MIRRGLVALELMWPCRPTPASLSCIKSLAILALAPTRAFWGTMKSINAALNSTSSSREPPSPSILVTAPRRAPGGLAPLSSHRTKQQSSFALRFFAPDVPLVRQPAQLAQSLPPNHQLLTRVDDASANSKDGCPRYVSYRIVILQC